MYYAILCEDTPNSLEKRKAVRPAHLKRLETLDKEGRLLSAGALLKQEAADLYQAGIHGSLIVADFSNLAEAKAWISADPFVTAEVYGKITVFPYRVSFPNEH